MWSQRTGITGQPTVCLGALGHFIPQNKFGLLKGFLQCTFYGSVHSDQPLCKAICVLTLVSVDKRNLLSVGPLNNKQPQKDFLKGTTPLFILLLRWNCVPLFHLTSVYPACLGATLWPVQEETHWGNRQEVPHPKIKMWSLEAWPAVPLGCRHS